MRCIQVFFILLRMGVPWVCRLEHTLVWFPILLVFLWVYQLGHRPSWQPSGHREHANGDPFPFSCFYCSFSSPFLFLVMSWNSNNIFILGDAVQTDAVLFCLGLGGKLLAPYSMLRRILELCYGYGFCLLTLSSTKVNFGVRFASYF